MGYLPDNWQSTVPKNVIEKISGQLQIDKAFFKTYGARAATKTEHLQTVLSYLGYNKWTMSNVVHLESWLLERALEHDKPTLLLDLACEKLISEKILRPSIGTLERIVIGVRVRAYEETYARLN